MRVFTLVILSAMIAVAGCATSNSESTSGSTVNMSNTPSNVTRGETRSADNTRIVYESRGDGPLTLVLIHGWACDRSYWDQQVAPLSSSFRVITLDLAGHGDSGVSREDWSMEAFGEDVAAVARALDAQDVVLVGHSMGGAVMLEAARRMPQRVRALIGVDTLKDPDEAITPAQAEGLWAAFAGNFETSVAGFVRSSFFLPSSDPDIVARISSDMAAAPPALSVSAGKRLSVYDRRAALKALSHLPLTLINAPIPPTQSANYAGVHDNMTLVVIDQAGHFPMQEVPALFNSILRKSVLKTP